MVDRATPIETPHLTHVTVPCAPSLEPPALQLKHARVVNRKHHSRASVLASGRLRLAVAAAAALPNCEKPHTDALRKDGCSMDRI